MASQIHMAGSTLNQGQPPVGEQQPHSLEQHAQRADGENEGGKPPPRTAQPQTSPSSTAAKSLSRIAAGFSWPARARQAAHRDGGRHRVPGGTGLAGNVPVRRAMKVGNSGAFPSIPTGAPSTRVERLMDLCAARP